MRSGARHFRWLWHSARPARRPECCCAHHVHRLDLRPGADIGSSAFPAHHAKPDETVSPSAPSTSKLKLCASRPSLGSSARSRHRELGISGGCGIQHGLLVPAHRHSILYSLTCGSRVWHVRRMLLCASRPSLGSSARSRHRELGISSPPRKARNSQLRLRADCAIAWKSTRYGQLSPFGLLVGSTT